MLGLVNGRKGCTGVWVISVGERFRSGSLIVRVYESKGIGHVEVPPSDKLAIGKDACCVQNDAVFLVEVREGHGMDFIGSSQAAVIITSCKREACVRDEIGLKSEIPCHSNGRLDRVIRAHASNYERLHSQLAQKSFELCANEGAICLLRNYCLPGRGSNLGLEVVPFLTGAVGRGWSRRVVADVNDRPVFSAPSDEKLRYAPFRVWIISRTIDRVIGRIDGLLHVNYD
jgi:hypothetical protein